MKFLVKRTSSYDEKPCNDERLVFEKYDRIEVRTCTEEEFNKKYSDREGLWRSKGTNHRTCNSGKYIQRTFPNAEEGWFIELDTLEQLIEFKKTCGHELIIGEGLFNREIVCLEIYDTWRE